MTAQRCLEPPRGHAAEAADAHRAVLPTCKTPRLTLRAPKLDDFPVWRDLMVPDTDGLLGGPHTEEEAWNSYCVYVAGWLLQGHGAWTVEIRDTGAVAGFVFVGLEWGDVDPEAGWMLLPEHRGKGYAQEAARHVIDHGRKLYGDGGIVSYIAPTNIPSNRLAERLGANRDRSAERVLSEEGDINVWRYGGQA